MRPSSAAPAEPVGRSPALRGLDFTSRPTRRKPSVLACGHRDGNRAVLTELRTLYTEADYAAALQEPGPWLMACDFPFGLPRELVGALGWPLTWRECLDHYASLERTAIRDTFRAFCAARPAGAKFAHRACDAPAGSSPSMKWVNPPVAFMLHAGVPPLLAAGCDLPGLHAGDPARVAVEAYPGMLARDVIGRRSYKSDDRLRQTPERRTARAELLDGLARGAGRFGLTLQAAPTLHAQLLDDASGDALDAALCLVTAAWAAGQPHWGRPADADALEGWIVGADLRVQGARA